MQFNLMLTFGGVMLIGAAGLMYKFGGDGGSTPQEPATGEAAENGPVHVSLAEASAEWTELTTKPVLPLSTASVLWVSAPEDNTNAFPRPEFTHAEIDTFYTEYIENRPSVEGDKRAVIISILDMLDEFGDCASVVRNPALADADNKFDDNSYAYLSNIPLYEHSLSVARAMVQRINRDALVPTGLIVALAHDLGKIPQWHARGYRTGDHPKISTMALDSIAEYSNLPNHLELSRIVAEHHSINPSNPHAQLLKECDILVRNKELSQMVIQAVQEDMAATDEATETADETVAPEQPPVAATPPTPSNHNSKNTIGWADTGAGEQARDSLPQIQNDPHQLAHPLGSDTRSSKFVPTRIDIPWFDPDVYLNEIKPLINLVHEKRWGAVSSPDGMVYINGTCLWKALKRVAPEEIKPALAAADAEESTQRGYLYTVVWTLSEKRNAIAADMINPNYYMIPVTIIDGSGKSVTQASGKPLFLTPFKAEAFGMLASELESTKAPVIRRMVKSIKPKVKGE